MKAIVAADIHGLDSGWQQLKQSLNPEDTLILAGDILGEKYPDSSHDYQPAKIKSELKALTNKIYLVLGNCDIASSLGTNNRELEFELFGKKVYLTHGDSPLTIPEIICREKNIDIYISGHTHCFELRQYQDCLILNPGSLTKSRAIYHTYATIENIGKKINCQLINVFSGEVISRLNL